MGGPTEPATVPGLPFDLAPVTVVVGHYGAGKTTFALNLALDAAAAGQAVTLADMDVVNPYFRSSEYAELLEGHGVRLIAPVFARAGTSLDVPSLTGEVVPAIQAAHAWQRASDGGEGPAGPRPVVIVDAGGDDVGATALARFAPALGAGPGEVLYVANAYRNLTRQPAEAVAVLREIEAKAAVAVTAVVGNSHLQGETTAALVREAVPFAQAVADGAGVPLRCVTVPKSAIQRESDGHGALVGLPGVYPVDVYVSPPWSLRPEA